MCINLILIPGQALFKKESYYQNQDRSISIIVMIDRAFLRRVLIIIIKNCISDEGTPEKANV